MGELILLAIDESGWTSLVGLNNTGFLAGADRGRPRVDWSDLEKYSEGLVAITGMPTELWNHGGVVQWGWMPRE